MKMRLIGAALAAACVAIGASGCGSSQHASGPSVIRAADVTAQQPGYRVSGSATISSSRTGAITLAMAGSFDRADHLGTLSTAVNAAGHQLKVFELLSQLTVYMGTSAIPGGAKLGKAWVKIDLSRAIGALNLSSLPSATDPTQFVDYLRAVSTNTKRLGTQTVGGSSTTHYHALVDLDRYPNLVAPAQRPAVQRSVKVLESALGSHTMPIDVWIDSHSLVRRIGLAFGECVSGNKFQFNMTMDLYDYGAQPKPSIPAASQVYDLTPLITRGLRNAKLGCSA